MSVDSYQPDKIFTVEEANATLPLVRAITADMVKLARDIVDRRQRLDHLKGGRDMTSDNPYDEELAQIEQELEKEAGQLQGYVDELRQLGVEPKSAAEGLIDFPAMIDDRLAYLCWRADEPEILFWHELDGGYAGRQRLTAEAVAGDSGEEELGPRQLDD